MSSARSESQGDREARALDVITEIFSDREEAVLLLARAGYPRTMIPSFNTPLAFWARVADSARHGILRGGVQSIIEQAALMYPNNPVLASFLTGSAHGAADSERAPSDEVQTRSTRGGTIDYLVITALDLEAEAVLDLLEPTDERTRVGGTLVEVARLDDIRLGIVTTGPGNQAAASMAAAVVTKMEPRGLVFIGVAGGIKDVRIGDIVVATKMYGYESGKVTDDGFLPRPEVGRSDHAFVQSARYVKRRKKWLPRAGIEGGEIPQVFVEPIAAGEKVVASANSDIARRLRSTYGDAVAVEMEGIGALEAAHQTDVPGLVVRGISDLLDGKTEADHGGSQPLAAKRAAAFALEVVLDYHATVHLRPEPGARRA